MLNNKMSKAFTMIELLMVMLIISVLSSIAIPQFINLKNEAKVASLKNMLNALRVGIKNQTQQAMLKCGAGVTPAGMVNKGGFSFFPALALHLPLNNATHYGATVNNAYMCSTAEIPNPADRKFIDFNIGNNAKRYNSAVEGVTTTQLPTNPFIVPNSDFDTYVFVSVHSNVETSYADGLCEWIELFTDSALYQSHWIGFTDTGEIHAGTNTPGIKECKF